MGCSVTDLAVELRTAAIRERNGARADDPRALSSAEHDVLMHAALVLAGHPQLAHEWGLILSERTAPPRRGADALSVVRP